MAKVATTATPQADAEDHGRGERTKTAIKRTIARLAMRHDLDDITLADICRGAKITTGALYFHFRNKEDAVLAMVIDQLAEAYAGIPGPSPDQAFKDLVMTVVRNNVHFHRRSRKLAGAIERIVQTQPAAYEAWLSAREPTRAALEAAIATARAAHGLPVASASYLAHIILTSVEDLAVDAFRWQNPTLAPYAADPEHWIGQQAALWSWTILAPLA